MEGKVSSKYQLTLPVEVRKALNVQPGDAVRYEVEGSSVRVSIVRPDIGDILDDVLDEFDFTSLKEATQDDAVSYLKHQRALDD